MQNATEDSKFTNRADVYALGVILYEMCTKNFTGPIFIEKVEEDVKNLGYSYELIDMLSDFLEPVEGERKSV